jgi:DNA-binding IclR family transcriptional regulator
MPVGDDHITTPEDIARWMLDELEKAGYLYQWEAVYQIQSRFGVDFTYLNESGNFAIDRRVLRAFHNLTEDTVVWRRTEGCWVKRGPHDPPGRKAAGRQAD